ncbi:BrxA family protein, partial [Armatimonas sp.]|uniref:BrxA family protein n=1 Tax=Armatimonas sp. TaxID=1872638 RepID=UPI0037532444
MYTTLLTAGLGQVNETKVLLELWEPGMAAGDLKVLALKSGRFPDMTARRLENIVTDCFAPRYLKGAPPAACYLKRLACTLPTTELLPLLLLYTSRANEVMRDFITLVYWERYAAGQMDIGSDDARVFLDRAIADGKTATTWSDKTVRLVSSGLVG